MRDEEAARNEGGRSSGAAGVGSGDAGAAGGSGGRGEGGGGGASSKGGRGGPGRKKGKGKGKGKGKEAAGSEDEGEPKKRRTRKASEEDVDDSADAAKVRGAKLLQQVQEEQARPCKYILDIFQTKNLSSLTKMPKSSAAAVGSGKKVATVYWTTGGKEDPPPAGFRDLEKCIREALPDFNSDVKAAAHGLAPGNLAQKEATCDLVMKVGWQAGHDLQDLNEEEVDDGRLEMHKLFKGFIPDGKGGGRYFSPGVFQKGDRVEIYDVPEDEELDDEEEEDEGRVPADWWSARVADARATDAGDQVKIKWQYEEDREEAGEWRDVNARVRHAGEEEHAKACVFVLTSTKPSSR